MKAKCLTLGFAVSMSLSGASAEKTDRALVRNVDGIDAVISVFRSVQFRSPPSAPGKLTVYEAGYLVFDPGRDSWPAALSSRWIVACR